MDLDPKRQATSKHQAHNHNGHHDRKLKQGLPKNVRKFTKDPRRGLAMLEPKKGGGGGKGTWGRPGDELNPAGYYIDEHDPNYDPQGEEASNVMLATIPTPLTTDDIDKVIKPILQEYYEIGDTLEVAEEFANLDISSIRSDIVLFALLQALDGKDDRKELTSVLLSDLYSHIFKVEEIEMGFDALLGRLDDLVLDYPDVATIAGKFMARAIADDILAPKFLQLEGRQSDSKLVKAAVDEANVLMQTKHSLYRLSSIWGEGSGRKPVKLLAQKMQETLQEYFSSLDKAEVERCLHDLDVPHFHHEFVYDAILNVLEEKEPSKHSELVRGLFLHLLQSGVLTTSQLTNGFLRIFLDLKEITIDVPRAHIVLEKFVAECVQSGVIPQSVANDLPARARKRMASENGNGGEFKED